MIGCEQTVAGSIGGVAVRLRVDRIDRQEHGLVIIDYKTGSAAIDVANWASDRITEPQLPLYAVLLSASDQPAPIAALVFGKAGVGDACFAGVTAARDVIARLKSVEQMNKWPAELRCWDTLLEHWKNRLTAIAEEFRRGEAGVVFDDEKALVYCDVAPLLRLAEAAEQWERGAVATAA